MTLHPNGQFEMTESEYTTYDDDLIGLCTNCGAERSSCEPDAREYICNDCGEAAVYGVPELLLMDRITLIDENDDANE